MADERIDYHHYRIKTDDEGNPIELGRGAMGIAYHAIDTKLGGEVVLKVINPKLLGDEVTSERFLREARASTSLRHPNIGEVLFFGEAQGTYFYTVEYVSGETLASRIRRSGSVGTVEALMIVEQVAVALIALEEGNVLHRDIKPGRISMGRSDEGELKVKLIDFGLVKNLLPDEASATWKSMIGYVEAPAFSSPEQLQYRPLDTRSDIYSLGVTLWYALAGELPFKGGVDEVISGHMRKALPMEQLVDQPEVARSLLGKMLEKDRVHRHASAADLHREILTCLEAISAQASQSSKKEVSGRNKTREEKERLFSEAVARAEQAAKTKRLAEQEQKLTESAELDRLEWERKEKARLESETRAKTKQAAEAEVKKEAEQEQKRKEAADRERKEKGRLEQEAKTKAEQEQKKQQERERKERERLAATAKADAEQKAKEELSQQQEKVAREKLRQKLEEATDHQSWKPVRTRKRRRSLVIVLVTAGVFVATAFFWPKETKAPAPAPDYIHATVLAWKSGDHKTAHENFNLAMEQNPVPANFDPKFRAFIQEVVMAVESGKLGPVPEAAVRWKLAITLAGELEIEEISAALDSIDRAQLAAAAVELWGKGDRAGTAQALAKFVGMDPELLPPSVVNLLEKIVSSFNEASSELSDVIGNEWEPALTLAAAREDSPAVLLLLANSIYSRAPSAAYPYYRDLLKREPKGESPARIRFCLRLLDRYPDSEGSFFRNELEKEFANVFAGNDVISTGELLKRIPLEDWKRSAEQGVTQAIYRLGQVYSSRGVESVVQDDAIALKWFEQAADAGLLSAKYSVAWMNINGRGIKTTQEKARAKGFAILAASSEADRKDLPKFSYELAICYEKGLGTGVDLEKAEQFYKEALKLFQVKYEEDELSYFRGYSLLLAKRGEWEKVGEVLRAGAERNDPASQLMLGSLYFDDKLESLIRRDSEIEHDPAKGEDLIIRAAKGGDSLAMKTCRKYGWIYK